MTEKSRQLVLRLLLAAHVVVSMVLAISWPTGGAVRLISHAWIGLQFAQINLLAVWFVFGRQPLLTRGPIVGFLAAMICLATAVRAREPLFLGSLPLQFGLIQLPLWGMQRLIGWKIYPLDATPADDSRVRRQFSIRQVLVWMAGVGIVLAVWRHYFRIDLEFLPSQSQLAVQAIVVLCNVLVPGPTLGVLAERSPIRWLLVCLLFMAPITMIEVHELRTLTRLGVYVEWTEFFIINGVHLVALALSLLALRACGLRFGVPGVAKIGATPDESL